MVFIPQQVPSVCWVQPFSIHRAATRSHSRESAARSRCAGCSAKAIAAQSWLGLRSSYTSAAQDWRPGAGRRRSSADQHSSVAPTSAAPTPPNRIIKAHEHCRVAVRARERGRRCRPPSSEATTFRSPPAPSTPRPTRRRLGARRRRRSLRQVSPARSLARAGSRCSAARTSPPLESSLLSSSSASRPESTGPSCKPAYEMCSSRDKECTTTRSVRCGSRGCSDRRRQEEKEDEGAQQGQPGRLGSRQTSFRVRLASVGACRWSRLRWATCSTMGCSCRNRRLGASVRPPCRSGWVDPTSGPSRVSARVRAILVPEARAHPQTSTGTGTERLKYHIAPRDATTASDLPTTCLAHAVFSARLVSLAADGSVPDPADTQTLFALDPPTWHPDSSTYLVVLPVGPPIPHRHYELDVRLEFGYYPGIQEGTPCGPRELKCKPQSLAAQGGKAMRYVGKAIPTRQFVEYGAGAAEEEEAVWAAGTACDDLSSLAGYWNDTTFRPTSPACSLSTPSIPLPDALFLAAVDGKPARPLWLHLVGDSNTRNTYKRLISALGRGFHATGPMVMGSTTHNGTQAGLAFRYRTGVPPEDESALVPDLVVTWMWWYQVAPLSSAGFMGMGDRAAEDVDPEFRANRDELLSFVDADLSTFLRTARLDAVLKTFPHLREVARGLRPHRTYLSLGSHGEDLSVPGVAASLDVLFNEAHGLSRAKRDAANLRLVTTTLVNARYIPLAQFPHQDLVRTNALIHARNVYARGRPEFGGTEGRVLDVEALTRGVVEDEAWMKQGKRGPDAVHFRAEVYDVWVRVLWTDLVSGVAVEPTEGKRDSTAARRWRRRRLLPDLEDDSP